MPSPSPHPHPVHAAALVHDSALVIDLHADTPQRFVDEEFDLAGPLKGGNFNLETARGGNLGAQFFSIWAEPSLYAGQYARRTLELMDGVQRQIARHRDKLALAVSADGIEQARRERRLAVLMGIEGGHSIEGSLALLRQYYALGARYMTLTWNNSNGWADSSSDLDNAQVAHTAEGLSRFGEDVIREMNRLGMMVDVSHVADRTLGRALAISRAPVIASHSSARALCDCPRNLSDEMLGAVAGSGGAGSQGGVVMVNFYSGFLSPSYREAQRSMQPEIDRQIGLLKERARAEGRALRYEEISRMQKAAADRIPRPPLSLLIDHIEHMIRVAGVEHVGLGSDFDGVAGQLPEGMDSPADLPKVTAALLERGYTAEDCRKVLGGNLMRVFRAVEAVASQLHQGQAEEESRI